MTRDACGMPRSLAPLHCVWVPPPSPPLVAPASTTLGPWLRSLVRSLSPPRRCNPSLFPSLRQVVPHVAASCGHNSQTIAMGQTLGRVGRLQQRQHSLGTSASGSPRFLLSWPGSCFLVHRVSSLPLSLRLPSPLHLSLCVSVSLSPSLSSPSSRRSLIVICLAGLNHSVLMCDLRSVKT